MARVPYVPLADIDPVHSDLIRRPINLGQALVNSSRGYGNHHMLGRWIREESTIDSRLRELLILQVGFVARNDYEVSHHVKLSRAFGVTSEDIQSLVAYSKGRPTNFSELERAALRAATELTVNADISDEIWAKLAENFDAEQLVEIVLIIGYYNHVVRLLSALRIDVEPEYEEYLADSN
ncbi:MAG: carboxymuconolactone decarboxylase family protein [Actinomycetota bacterium]|nr:carboxymuconolactone decarboxylase family protein [Actinomycetota bacterium]